MESVTRLALVLFFPFPARNPPDLALRPLCRGCHDAIVVPKKKLNLRYCKPLELFFFVGSPKEETQVVAMASGSKATPLAEEQGTDLSSSVELSVDDLEIKVLVLKECFVYRIPKAQIGRE